MPAPGAAVTAGESFGSVESVKAVSEIYSPVTGEVVEANETLKDAPEKLNDDPHGEAWLVKIRLSDKSQIEGLMDAGAYQAYIAE
jgi:glycine cleavage system H protein